MDGEAQVQVQAETEVEVETSSSGWKVSKGWCAVCAVLCTVCAGYWYDVIYIVV